MTREITLLHVDSKAIGYGRLGVCLHENLERLGVEVYDDLGIGPASLYESSADKLVREGRRTPASPTNVASWISVPTHARWWWKGQFTSIFTMWEATVLPPTFRSTLHYFDRVIVPSEQNLELFSRYHKDVRYVPLGVDTERWRYTPRRESDPYFTFLHGGSGKRKGGDLVHAAYTTVFGPLFDSTGRFKGDGPIPQLIFKSPKGERYYGPNVHVVTGRLTDDEEVTLYEQAHCYIQPSRGEGFGLQPLQALAQGIPTILTDAHGHTAFSEYGIGIPAELRPADYFIYGDAGDWWEPDFETLCEAMWDVYQRYDWHRDQARHPAQVGIPRDFSWLTVASRFIDVHDGALDGIYQGDGSHVMPKQRLYRVRVREPWRADISGVVYFFEPGIDYYEPADVKRILFEAHKLDPECLRDDDNGLTVEQAEKIPQYSASMRGCPTCGQILNSGRSVADEIYEEMENQAAQVSA